MLLLLFFLSLLWFVVATNAADSSGDNGYSSDPILRYRPPFSKSLPVQILSTGIILTLVVMLFLHLLFTAQYHYPMARANYVLQMICVISLMVSLIATLYLIFRSTVQESQHWPYMLSYLQVDMPRFDYGNGPTNSTDPTMLYAHVWTAAESATWIVMNATTSTVVQITHIHFLTLLYPSSLEARLIFCLLGPLAIVAAVMQVLPVAITSPEVLSVLEDVRNVCNATLSLLFTTALVLWGFVVNREQAWRTDGGTATFGAGAIILALISTTLNFFYIPRSDQYTWLPKLIWAVTLWQSFLGYWWWVGSGVGVREAEKRIEWEEKNIQKRQLRAQRRKEQREKAKVVWKGVTSAFKPKPDSLGSLQKRRAQSSDSDAVSVGEGEAPDDQSERHAGSATVMDSGSTAPSSSAVDSTGPTFLRPWRSWFTALRHAHLTAAREQAVERTERIHQVYGREDRRNSQREPNARVIGWGLGSFGLRQSERGRRELEDGAVDDETDAATLTNEPGVVGDAEDGRGRSRTRQALAIEETEARTWTRTLWWWSPFRQWRLQDSTAYR
ncbi:hypothetical protein CONPUDRAFT_137573, partial [Coniophora puteana RWD-64-598 SS2]